MFNNSDLLDELDPDLNYYEANGYLDENHSKYYTVEEFTEISKIFNNPSGEVWTNKRLLR